MKKFILLTIMSIAAGTALMAQVVDMSVCASKGYTLNSTAANPPFGATTYQWVEISSAGTSEVGTNQDTYSVEARTKAVGTYQYVRMASNEECPGGVPSNTYTVRVLPAPDPPTMGGDGNTYCGSGTITATPGYGGTGIRWDDGSTVTLRTVNASGTYYAVTTPDEGCESGSASVTVNFTLPGANGEAATACGCAEGLIDCSGQCRSASGMAYWTTCSSAGFTYVSDVSAECGIALAWQNANDICSDKGMNLPTLPQFECMCDNGSNLPGGYDPGLPYWTSTMMNPTLAQVRFFGYCTQGYSYPITSSNNRTKCVK